MEFDNDRLVKGLHKKEIAAWLLMLLLQPVANCLAVFPQRPIAWIVISIIALLVWPFYLLYAKFIVPRFLFKKQYLVFGGLTFAFFVLVHAWIFILYQPAKNILPAAGDHYFLYPFTGFARETYWIVINTCLSVAIAWLGQQLEDAETIEALQKENTFYKLRYFRTQLNPHFLFNTLNSIYSLSLQQKEKTPEVIIRLSDIMRFLIYECNEDKIPIQKEIEFIRNYIEIERIRYDADIRFTIEGETEGVMIEPFLFISFIENGFKHAIDHSFAKPFIYITLKITPYRIALNVINNTSFELEHQAKKIKGKGLENSKSVLELLYPEAYALDIIQTEKAERKDNKLRLKNAQERLERLYPDTHTLDVILSNNTFTVSLILITHSLDKMYHYRR